ncbi:hypothetical protein WOLCODRAFT_21375 [Wolfiporia cocos MD-104 SS10]|uniref:DUF6534 domain-containing protein n=1 Tax=Wolfiporia cocos (strain MD-104) TaxID=742152 RepID=A0A2H3JR85_WOLCO|nr:hypothetical protein WOLCODRAFT_21375 [Wolfiporia cocos MD-104 SS10]
MYDNFLNAGLSIGFSGYMTRFDRNWIMKVAKRHCRELASASLDTGTQPEHRFLYQLLIQLVSLLVTDLVIAITLCWTFQQSKHGPSSTIITLSKLIMSAVQRGVMLRYVNSTIHGEHYKQNTTFSIIEIALIVAAVEDRQHGTNTIDLFYFPIGSGEGPDIGAVYVNALLTTLNARRYLRSIIDDTAHNSVDCFCVIRRCSVDYGIKK